MSESNAVESGALVMIREAASKMRHFADKAETRWESPTPRVFAQAKVQRSVAAWLDAAGADLWAHGPLCCSDGCEACDDALWMPHARRAITVARDYLDMVGSLAPTSDDAEEA